MTGAGDPAGDAFAQLQFESRRIRRQAVRHFDFQETGGRIEQHDGSTGGADQAHRFAEDQFQRCARFERGMDDVADLIQQLEPFAAGFQFSQFVAHRSSRRVFRFQLQVRLTAVVTPGNLTR